ncbi:MAG: cation:proton antiporter, partial [Rhodospirillales bacterium]|nr:cation:proton antiporter [Rhodospirillales bacterium]
LLAELSIALLLFIVAAQLSLRAFLATWKTAVTAVAVQITVSLTVMLACSWVLGLSMAMSVLLGFAAALSSAAVTTTMLHQLGAGRGRIGRVTTGILIAQAFAFLPMLFLVDYLGANGVGANGIGAELIGKIVIAAALLAMLVKFLSGRKPLDLPVIRGVDSRIDLAPFTALAYCLAAASVFGVLGLSAPFGAFLAGLVIGRSNQRKRMMAPFRPLQNILVMGAFLSIGLLSDMGFIMSNLGGVLFLLLMISLVKAAAHMATLRVLGQSWRTASLAGLTLSQMGEFPIILAVAAMGAGVIGKQDLQLVIAVTCLGLILSPLWLSAARRVHGIAGTEDLTLGEISMAAFSDDWAALRGYFNLARQGEFRAIADGMKARRRLKPTPLPANDDEDPPEFPRVEPEQDTAETIAAIGAGVRAARFGKRDTGPDGGRENSNS